MNSLLILPGTDEFLNTLTASQCFLRSEAFQKQDKALVQDSETGLYRKASANEVFDYFHGGEYEETLEKFDDDELAIDGNETTYEPLVIIPTACDRY